MTEREFGLMEEYMRGCMRDAAHDTEHVYRVLYNALDIASHEQNVDFDVLISACLLHDVGREEEFADPSVDHAEVGAEKAYRLLTENGKDREFASRVRDCIAAHRFSAARPPKSIEAKILFDADKLDVTGATGVARTLVYNGRMAEPLYVKGRDGLPTDGSDEIPSFFGEYHRKLKRLYGAFYTKRGEEIANSRRAAAKSFYESLQSEVNQAYSSGIAALDKLIKRD